MSTMLASRRTSTLLTRSTIAVLAVVAIAMPMLMADVTFFMQMVLAAIVVTGLSLLMGFAGQASLGQGAFFAVGALTVGIGTTTWALPPLLALVLAPVLASAFAALVGIPLLRLRGHYLAFGTLALLLMVVAAMNTFDYLGGSFGISGIPPLAIGSYEITDPRDYAYLALGCLALVLVISRNLVSSRFGRGIQALAGSETLRRPRASTCSRPSSRCSRSRRPSPGSPAVCRRSSLPSSAPSPSRPRGRSSTSSWRSSEVSERCGAESPAPS